ncbi:putative glycolipid-binding domain-containing protein [Actinoplanes sp. NPDC048967]|uniref:putative glycolipid-binding domain-containing protein n=1 Tax=Actinoplanes sp. NPDC048967 TaxID=3155269 RepID=UPI003409F2C3
MSIDSARITHTPGPVLTGGDRGPYGPLVWQRTDIVGTELVFQSGTEPRTVTGCSVVAGVLPHTTRFHAEIDTGYAVSALTVTCAGADWSRELRMSRDQDGGWSCRTAESGDFGRSAAHSGHPAPLPGIDDPDRLTGARVLRLADSPIFVTWALRHLHLAAGEPSKVAPTIRVLTPSLVVEPARSAYQLVSEHRLRISGGERPTTYELDRGGLVLAQPARLRLAR